MSNIKDNGSYAFPTNILNVPFDDSDNQKYLGMSLRDYFAAKALSFTIESTTTIKSSGSDISVTLDVGKAARLSYQIADAMLLERSKS